MIASPFVHSFRYIPHSEKYDFNPYFPFVNSCSTGKIQRYTYPMAFTPFFYNIPYFYLDGE